MKTLPSHALEDAVGKLVEEFSPEAIYLFGSHAWGVPTDDSDVDLFVIVSQTSENPIARAQRAHRSLSGVGFAKDVIVATRAEVDRFKHLRASLSHQILNQGRKLYG